MRTGPAAGPLTVSLAGRAGRPKGRRGTAPATPDGVPGPTGPPRCGRPAWCTAASTPPASRHRRDRCGEARQGWPGRWRFGMVVQAGRWRAGWICGLPGPRSGSWGLDGPGVDLSAQPVHGGADCAAVALGRAAGGLAADGVVRRRRGGDDPGGPWSTATMIRLGGGAVGVRGLVEPRRGRRRR
ncbi:hypothetical protein HBB16_09960 [Pseudonocardia sp. MCCB 268]|nr:hypothetical protein [Pseudonocardia cytotoxica]